MSISTYKVTKKSAHIQVFSLDMCRLNYGLSLYRDFFSALKQMSEILSVSQRTIERDLSTLQKNGVLKRQGKDNGGVWIVVFN